MGQSDLEVLIDMGFEKARAEIAVKKSGGRKLPSLAFLCIYLILFFSSRCPPVVGRQPRQAPRRHHQLRKRGRDKPLHRARPTKGR